MYSIDTLKYKDTLVNFMRRFGVSCNLENPQTIQEKLAWLNLYECPMHSSGQPLKSFCADKIKLHEYSKEILGEDICIPILKTYDKVEDINWDELPNKFVMKCNHGSGMNIICKDKSSLDKQKAIRDLTWWMKDDYAFRNGFEAHYHDIEHKIFVEEYMSDDINNSKLTDYKFWCFNGKPGFIHVVDDRYSNLMHFNFYDTKFNIIPLEQTNHPKSNYIIQTPKSLDIMNEYASKLSSNFKFARVDFYEINNKLYLGEITFCPDCFIFKYKNSEDNKKIGDLLSL